MNKRGLKSKILRIIIILIIILWTGCISVNAETNNWSDWQKRDYWEWHTRTTTNDKAYNGEHIVIENNVIDFYGYGVISYKDFLYKKYSNYGRKVFSFRIDESKANYHTLDGAGIIFNSNIVNNKLTGYILLFKESKIVIYSLKNINIETLETAENATIGTYGTVIAECTKNNTGIHDLVVEITPTNISVTENNSKIINQNLEYSSNNGNDFGLISSYLQHDCAIVSKIQFSQFDIKIEDYTYEILNTDADNNPINGGTFLIKNEEGNTVCEGTASKNGIYTAKELKPGKYTVKQTKAPEGYEINNEEITFIVSNDGKILDVNTNKETKLIIKNNKKQTTANQSNIKTNQTTIQKDQTTANKSIPKAGMKTILALIGAVLIIIIALFIKYNKYNKMLK